MILTSYLQDHKSKWDLSICGGIEAFRETSNQGRAHEGVCVRSLLSAVMKRHWHELGTMTSIDGHGHGHGVR